MKCNKCDEKAVHSHNNLTLCKNHFLDYFESKVFHTIKHYHLINRDDNVCIATSGGKDSLTVLYLTMKYCKKHNINFFALAVDEGIKGYRDKTLDDLKTFCSQYDIPVKIVSFKERFGSTLDDVREKAMKELNKKPCTVCGIFRRTSLNRESRALGATKLVTGHNLDDESQSFIMNITKGNMRHNAGLGPTTGLNTNDKFVTRVKPLYFISEQETRLFCFLKGFKVDFSECPNIHLSFRSHCRDQLNDLEAKFPGTKQGIVNSFLEILPMLKEHYKNTKKFSMCTKCGDPCAGTICNACKLEKELMIKT